MFLNTETESEHFQRVAWFISGLSCKTGFLMKKKSCPYTSAKQTKVLGLLINPIREACLP